MSVEKIVRILDMHGIDWYFARWDEKIFILKLYEENDGNYAIETVDVTNYSTKQLKKLLGC